jgi:hypothetical protein
MSFQVGTNHKVNRNEKFERKAELLFPDFYKEKNHPVHIVKTTSDKHFIHGWKVEPLESATTLKEKDFGKGDSFILDFGQHQVGYLKMQIIPVGSPPDAPLHIRLTFAEMPVEVSEPFSSYDGWISSSWLQEETLHVDVLPKKVELPRRYSFRYVKIEILDTSKKYRVAFKDIYCETVTTGDIKKVTPLNHSDLELDQIDQVSIKTLQDCMQEVFEDGPKRDRRLWLGDLRLQALANYKTFKNNDLVKRNLYLFAAVPNEEGKVSANLFIAPNLVPDDTFLFDYSLFFTTTLYDYYIETKDFKTLEGLWSVAYRQVELGLERVDENGNVRDGESWWSFIDWQPELNKQAPSQAILIYTLKKIIFLADVLGKTEKVKLEEHLERIIRATFIHLWDEEKGLFVSGKEKQISWASQVWMALAQILDLNANKKLMNRLLETKPAIGMNTPYMYHHLVEALLLVEEKEEAISVLKQYWGGMIRDGADTFWELYNPENKEYSPYGNHLINSYCHAWSCTPTYLIREYNL